MNENQSLDRLLRRASRASGRAKRSGPCLDPETLAAWVDNTMRADERAAAEAHVADCGRCLALLGAMAQTAPKSQPAAGAGWLPVRWLAPIAAAAVAITTWVIVNRDTHPPAPTVQRETTRSQPTPEAAALEPSREPDISANSEPSGKPKVTPVEPRVLRDSTSPVRSESRSSDLGAVAARTSEADAAAENRSQLPRSRASTAPPAAPSPGPTARAFSTSEQSFVIASPRRAVQWRISGAVIQRSIDDGRTWQRQASPQVPTLIAGSSPAPEVCWLAGPGGVVLVTTDGETWRRLQFPDPSADLVGVSARDAEAATVTSADGRVFATTDGGRTWALQEHPPAPF